MLAIRKSAAALNERLLDDPQLLHVTCADVCGNIGMDEYAGYREQAYAVRMSPER
jgi:hypothetical protein